VSAKGEQSWPLPAELEEDEALVKRLYSAPGNKINATLQHVDWSLIHREMKGKSVTLQLLWHEYKERYPQGLSYSRYSEHYREWRQKLDVYMRQVYKVGEKLFVDYAGMTMPIVVNGDTGEIQEAQIFVCALGASSMAYVEATWTQQLPDWIGSHTRAFTFYEGVPEIVVPDNLRSGVQKAHRYEPDINPTYQDMAHHYGVAIIPARAYSPRDKAKAEQTVQQVERHILAKLRHHKFFSLGELNKAISPLLDAMNRRPFQKLPGSRYSEFELIEKKALKPLPITRYVFSEWKKIRLGLDYHITLDQHHYSVPYHLVKKEVELRYTKETLEMFYKGKRVAAHRRSDETGGWTTVLEHMPKSHREHAKWNLDAIIRQAKQIGEFTHKLVEKMMAREDTHPQQNARSCLGLIRLEKRYGKIRIEAACYRAFSIGAVRYKSVLSILENNLDQQPLPEKAEENKQASKVHHEYVRGSDYFH